MNKFLAIILFFPLRFFFYLYRIIVGDILTGIVDIITDIFTLKLVSLIFDILAFALIPFDIVIGLFYTLFVAAGTSAEIRNGNENILESAGNAINNLNKK